MCVGCIQLGGTQFLYTTFLSDFGMNVPKYVCECLKQFSTSCNSKYL